MRTSKQKRSILKHLGIRRHLKGPHHKIGVEKCHLCSSFFLEKGGLDAHTSQGRECRRKGVLKGSGQVALWRSLYKSLYRECMHPDSPYYTTQDNATDEMKYAEISQLRAERTPHIPAAADILPALHEDGELMINALGSHDTGANPPYREAPLHRNHAPGHCQGSPRFSNQSQEPQETWSYLPSSMPGQATNPVEIQETMNAAVVMNPPFSFEEMSCAPQWESSGNRDSFQSPLTHSGDSHQPQQVIRPDHSEVHYWSQGMHSNFTQDGSLFRSYQDSPRTEFQPLNGALDMTTAWPY